MSDNKKYYYLKLKENYFERDNVKVLESMENGYLYSLIILKLYLKSLKHDGQLKMTYRIPYSIDNLQVLANVINHDVDHLKQAVKLGIELDLITINDYNQLFMTDIQNFIGLSSTEADRIREYRKSITKDVQLYNNNTPEKEKEKEKKIKRKEKFKKPSLDELKEYFKEKVIKQFTPESFYNFYESKGWMVGKNKMVSWKGAVNTWIQRYKQDNKKEDYIIYLGDGKYKNKTTGEIFYDKQN